LQPKIKLEEVLVSNQDKPPSLPQFRQQHPKSSESVLPIPQPQVNNPSCLFPEAVLRVETRRDSSALPLWKNFDRFLYEDEQARMPPPLVPASSEMHRMTSFRAHSSGPTQYSPSPSLPFETSAARSSPFIPSEAYCSKFLPGMHNYVASSCDDMPNSLSIPTFQCSTVATSPYFPPPLSTASITSTPTESYICTPYTSPLYQSIATPLTDGLDIPRSSAILREADRFSEFSNIGGWPVES